MEKVTSFNSIEEIHQHINLLKEKLQALGVSDDFNSINKNLNAAQATINDYAPKGLCHDPRSGEMVAEYEHVYQQMRDLINKSQDILLNIGSVWSLSFNHHQQVKKMKKFFGSFAVIACLGMSSPSFAGIGTVIAVGKGVVAGYAVNKATEAATEAGTEAVKEKVESSETFKQAKAEYHHIKEKSADAVNKAKDKYHQMKIQLAEAAQKNKQ